jgi:uroporphyrinogen-III synthase
MGGCDLKGCGISVTRAAHQAENLASMIHACQGRVIRFPAIEIWPGQAPDAARQLLQQRWDWIIFVSPNAVRFALKLLPGSQWGEAGVGAVGAATAKQLQQAGKSVDLIPRQSYDSEGLLSLPELSNLQDRAVLIVRGEGGRALLGETLEARGGKVRYAEVYRRVKPKTPVDRLLQRWPEEIQLVTVTSNEVLNNLVELLGEPGWPILSRTPIMVISERMQREAVRLGFDEIIRASAADDSSLVAAICDWAEKTEQGMTGE